MKTPYEHRAKYGLHNIVFGKPSKEAKLLYWFLLGLFLVLIFTYIFLA